MIKDRVPDHPLYIARKSGYRWTYHTLYKDSPPKAYIIWGTTSNPHKPDYVKKEDAVVVEILGMNILYMCFPAPAIA